MPSSPGSQRRGGHIIIGLALLVMGCAVLVIAFARQAERARASDSVPACVSADTAHAMVPASAPEPASASTTATGLTSSAGTDGGAAVHGVIRDAGADAGDAESDVASAHDFWFYAGTLALAKDDRQRIVALGTALARRPDLRVTVEGFGDQGGGGDVDAAALGRRRARIGQVLLARAGVAEARIALGVGDPTAQPHLARAVHITTVSVPVEVDP